jgi:hypothetical protein
MELLDWDEKHCGSWEWFCLDCAMGGLIVTRIVASAIYRAEEVRHERGLDVVPIICAFCNADALIIEKYHED